MKPSEGRVAKRIGVTLIVCGALLELASVVVVFNLLGLKRLNDILFSIDRDGSVTTFSATQAHADVFAFSAGLVAVGIILVLWAKQKHSPPTPLPPSPPSPPSPNIEPLEQRRFL